jgi:hypothetical protein
VGQDWGDLLLEVPWLAVTATLALRGSHRGLFLLAGGLLYACYAFVIYCLAVHFNTLFLVYCAALGVSSFALAGAVAALLRDDARRWYPKQAPVRTAGIFLIVIGVLFASMWLADIVPALVNGTVPSSIAETGTPTNAVHVIDLSVVLPLHVIAGMALLRRRPLGYALAPVVLAFDFLMALSIAGMMVVMRQRAIDASMAVATAMGVLSVGSGTILALLFRRVNRREPVADTSPAPSLPGRAS